MIEIISNSIMPLVIFFIILYGCIKKTNIYEDFTEGALDGLKIVVDLLSTLLGLFLSVRIFNDSGALDLITKLFSPIAKLFHTSACIIPVIITKLFSSGSATSLMLNIFSSYGPDSEEGLTAAIILSCTESLFYTMSVYLTAAKVSKSRYIIPFSLAAMSVGVAASITMAKIM